ncbi:MAG: ester cyclase [Candidatus Pacebacteria bacterium]|nr:ester cyclase [Candidatus Paceibacterota bacterium]
MQDSPSDPIGQNKQLVAKFYRAISLHNIVLLDGILDPDWQVYPVTGEGGRAAWEPGLLSLFEAFSDIQVAVQELIAENDFVAARIQFSGTQNGRFLSLPPTGRQIQFAGHDIHRIRYGKIVESWHIEDWLTVFRDLGARPQF